MKATMNMSSYETEHEVLEEDYGDEILSSGWNPEVDTVCQQLQLVSASEQMAVPEELASEVAEMFLRKMYSYQR